MAYLWTFTLLDDAYFFLNRAKSMTDTPSAKRGKGRFIRSSVLFSWQALEEATKSRLKHLSPATMPKKFSEKLKLALTLQGTVQAFREADFYRHYKLRNDIIHVNHNAPDPAFHDAEEMFNYCKDMLQGLHPRDEILITIDPI
jgi:hypothetical protein